MSLSTTLDGKIKDINAELFGLNDGINAITGKTCKSAVKDFTLVESGDKKDETYGCVKVTDSKKSTDTVSGSMDMKANIAGVSIEAKTSLLNTVETNATTCTYIMHDKWVNMKTFYWIYFR
ncbi:MAG: hypothetical protein HRO68_04525 [Nitrosopumilus sp.]|nr:hypothetical protein [Nitrosopumilus sp.]